MENILEADTVGKKRALVLHGWTLCPSPLDRGVSNYLTTPLLEQ